MNILLTGADRGLGYGTCKRLLELGHTVFAGQYLAEWHELDELQKQWANTLFPIPLDVSDINSVNNAVGLVQAKTDTIDIIINNAGISGKLISNTEEASAKTEVTVQKITANTDNNLFHDLDAMRRAYETNTLGPVRVIEAFIPLMKNSVIKRLCFVSSEAGSVTKSRRTEMFGYCMSKAAVNMYVKILFNRLHPIGYSFRLYHPGWVRSYMGGVKSEHGAIEPEEAGRYAVRHYLSKTVNEDELHLIDYTGKTWPF